MFWQKLRYIGWPYLRLWLLLHSALVVLGALLTWLWPLAELSVSLGTMLGTLFLAMLASTWGMHNALELVPKPPGRVLGNRATLFSCLVSLTFVCVIASVPAYTIERFARLQELPTLAALPQYPPARYYQPRAALLDTAHCRVAPSTDVSGGKSPHRYFQLAVACPVTNRLPAAASGAAVWLGLYYQSDTSSISFSTADYWASYQHFIVQQRTLARQDITQPYYYVERVSGDSPPAQALQDALPAGLDSVVVVRPVYTPFEERGSFSASFWLWSQLIGNSLLFLVLLALPLNITTVRTR